MCTISTQIACKQNKIAFILLVIQNISMCLFCHSCYLFIYIYTYKLLFIHILVFVFSFSPFPCDAFFKTRRLPLSHENTPSVPIFWRFSDSFMLLFQMDTMHMVWFLLTYYKFTVGVHAWILPRLLLLLWTLTISPTRLLFFIIT